MIFLEKAIEFQLKKYSLSELSINRFVFRDRLEELIERLLEEYASKRFDMLLSQRRISVKAFENFPKSKMISEKTDEVFKKNFYESLEELNSEELAFIRRLDSEALPNIKFWVRVREKKDPFYLQGWRPNKFYPDFVALCKDGKIVVLEWKGRDRLTSEDTAYKVELAKKWQDLGKGKLCFFLVHLGNVEKVLNEVKAC
jgi:type III restriction enzyme